MVWFGLVFLLVSGHVHADGAAACLLYCDSLTLGGGKCLFSTFLCPLYFLSSGHINPCLT